MSLQLLSVIQKYVEASNQHDVEAILTCFSDDAVVRDEGNEFRRKEMIRRWLVETIDKYKFHFEPASVKKDKAEVVVAIEISGTFPGSPVTPDYHFTLDKEEILALAIN